MERLRLYNMNEVLFSLYHSKELISEHRLQLLTIILLILNFMHVQSVLILRRHPLKLLNLHRMESICGKRVNLLINNVIKEITLT